VRNYCRRLRSATPETKIIVLRPVVEADVERSSTRMHEAGADIVVHNAREAVDAIQKLLAEAPVTRTALKTVGQASG
jgi:2-methylisocitrate lyase-like PEP mutase family enzyme